MTKEKVSVKARQNAASTMNVCITDKMSVALEKMASLCRADRHEEFSLETCNVRITITCGRCTPLTIVDLLGIKISDFTGQWLIPAPHPHPSYTTGYIRGTRRELVEHEPQPSALLCIETYEICASRSGRVLVYNAATSCATHVPFFALPFLQVFRAALWQV